MANERKVTPWFPGTEKPARNGWYETMRRDVQLVRCRRWNGEYWSFASTISQQGFGKSATQNYEWRGLASKPKESA